MHTVRSALKSWLSRRGGLLIAILALFLLTAATSRESSTTRDAHVARSASLQHEPQFILAAVARRMAVRLAREIPAPTVLFESKISPSRWGAAAERHWGARPNAFVSFFALTKNEIYLIDDVASHARRGSTLDDVLAHEMVHYLQAMYRKDALETDWAEFEAVAIQKWFRAEYMDAGRGDLRADLERGISFP